MLYAVIARLQIKSEDLNPDGQLNFDQMTRKLNFLWEELNRVTYTSKDTLQKVRCEFMIVAVIEEPYMKECEQLLADHLCQGKAIIVTLPTNRLVDAHGDPKVGWSPHEDSSAQTVRPLDGTAKRQKVTGLQGAGAENDAFPKIDDSASDKSQSDEELFDQVLNLELYHLTRIADLRALSTEREVEKLDKAQGMLSDNCAEIASRQDKLKLNLSHYRVGDFGMGRVRKCAMMLAEHWKLERYLNCTLSQLFNNMPLL